MSPRILLFLALAGGTAAAPADKRGYTWSNPTPRELLREMATDRPDTTESPTTVDAGHVQVEMSFAAFERDRHTPERDGVELEVWNVAPMNVRLGLRHDLELQVVVDNYVRAEAQAPALGLRERVSGFGDVTLRLKRNFLGNDGGDTAWALMPFVKIPTSSGGVGNDHVEGGLILPVNFTVGGLGLAAMTEVDLVRNAADDGYTLAWLNTLAYGFDLTARLGGFVELASLSGEGRHALMFDCGLTFAVNPDLQLDCGVNLGLTRAAPDLVVFAGLSRRF
ncbi:MAG TPA: transporter [Opitutaceae bacterium]|nr:transporter [Opitutaceae bacterium]